MAEIKTQRADIQALRGVHLWHAGLSSCSQRVRFLLEEKRIPWTGHMVDLFHFEHATPEYQQINPKGLVPTLVHDGKTIIESNEILVYLDRHFDGPRFTFEDGGDEVLDLLKRSGGILLSLRTLSHELLFYKRRLTQEQLSVLAATYRNSEFMEFLRRFSTSGFGDDRLLECLLEIDVQFRMLDRRLAGMAWIMGERLSVADFSWIVTVHRLTLMRFPLGLYPNLSAWYERVKARPSFQAALAAFEGEFSEPDGAARARARALFENFDLRRATN